MESSFLPYELFLFRQLFFSKKRHKFSLVEFRVCHRNEIDDPTKKSMRSGTCGFRCENIGGLITNADKESGI